MSREEDMNLNGSKTILVVEDSPVQAFAMIQLLEQHGLNVLCAPDGLAGGAFVEKSPPALNIPDIHMPGMDGVQTCHLLKQNPAFQDVPVIFLTAYGEPEKLRKGLNEGAVDFIPKDAFTDIVLVKTLQELDMIVDEVAEDDK